jgi:hypothetical protein
MSVHSQHMSNRIMLLHMGAMLGTAILVNPNEKAFIDMLQHVSEILNRKESNKAG